MPTIGALGNTVFHVSSNMVNTFFNMELNTNTNYAVHDRHLSGGILEYTGNAPSTLSFEMFHSIHLGVDPVSMINRLDASRRAGMAMMLIIGPYRYGTLWVITGIGIPLKTIDGRGNLIIAQQKVSLKSYD